MKTYSFNVVLDGKTIAIQQKDLTLLKHLDEISLEYAISETAEEIVVTVILMKVGFHDSIFMRFLDNAHSSFDITYLMNVLKAGNDYFGYMELSVNINKRIELWVRSLGKYTYTWTGLVEKPNYGLELFTNRFWPYFNVECKDWQDMAAAVRNEEYPQIQSNSVDAEYSNEYDLSQKYNNFSGYAVLNPNSYPNIENALDKLYLLSNLKLKFLMFEAVLRLLISPSICHIIKYSKLWELINPLFAESKHYREIFMRYFYYAMFILNHEDTVMFSRIQANYRIIFTHREALLLPQTHTLHIEQDPYIQQLTGISLIQTLPFYLRCERYIQPISVFERRFYLATGGAFANINLVKYNAAVSGSILVPCTTFLELEKDFEQVRFNTERDVKRFQYNSNLYEPIKGEKLSEKDKDFMSYLEYYYPSYHSLHDCDYIKQVLTKSEDILKCDEKKEEKKEERKESIKKPKYNELTDIDISITSDNYDTFEEIAKSIFERIRINCQNIGEVWLQKVYTASTFKFKLYGPGLIRPIDMFRISYGPDKMVKKFHCPIVRSWYDNCNLQNTEGSNMIISACFTMMCGVNNNYKWFFTSKPCTEVILKVAQRGFTTICTEKEIKALKVYMSKSERWKDLINDNIDMCGIMSKEHIFFNPCAVNGGIRYNLRPFKKPLVQYYSRRLHVGIAKTATSYDVDLAVKNNSKVYMPDNIINKFVDFMEQNSADDFSDTECEF